MGHGASGKPGGSSRETPFWGSLYAAGQWSGLMQGRGFRVHPVVAAPCVIIRIGWGVVWYGVVMCGHGRVGPFSRQEVLDRIRACPPRDPDAQLQLEKYLLQQASVIAASAATLDGFLRELDVPSHVIGALYLL
jgi:hypothetical protein